jgi:predicted nuclease with TOPRIM domain|tara:strand:- start:750 stop:956 length:207 start_codon:yes stop_codon:yes gene_type:complete
MAFEQWWRRQEERIRILLSEVEALKYRVNSLEGENTNLREQIRNYLQEINDLKIKLEEIDYLKLIIER